MRNPCSGVTRKFFPLDKNYLLEEVQLSLQDTLLAALVDKVKVAHQHVHNPLGLNDTFSCHIREYEVTTYKPLYEFYQNLAAVYRLKYGDIQLQFLWDGSDHQDVYRAQWPQTFEQWTDEFCESELFIQAVLDLSVFLPVNRKVDLVESRMNHFILKHLDVKFHKTRGLVAMRVA